MELTESQRMAVLEAARREPSRWKNKVRKIWERGPTAGLDGTDSNLCAALYTLRNTHGPSWLMRVRVKGGAIK